MKIVPIENEERRLSDLEGSHLLLMRPGESKINDFIRRDIKKEHPEIHIQDVSPNYSMSTFNLPLENGGILLSLDCWKDVHPGLVSIPLKENYSLPYGIATAGNPKNDVVEFIAAIKKVLREKGDEC